MAFAMKLAQKKADLSECPHASEEAKTVLGAASEPPIRKVQIGRKQPLVIGNETVMFRHEKTFFHQTGIAIELRSSEGMSSLSSRVKKIEDFAVERVGEKLRTDLFFITHDAGDDQALLDIIRLVRDSSTKGIILDCSDKTLLRTSLEELKDERATVFLRDPVGDEDIELTKTYQASLILTAETLEELVDQAEKARQAGFSNLLLNVPADHDGPHLENNTIIRRSALKNQFKPFGYPLFTRIQAEDEYGLMASAAVSICKYDSVIVLPRFDEALLYTLFTLRQNIYTDPQKPIQVDPKVYPIGDPKPDSPVFVTTNFSLTYFMVSGEIENSGLSAHLVICDTEGQSVLTAWAAGKFTGEKIAKFLKDIKLEEEVQTRKIIIPGYVSQISGELEENLPGWEVIVGCQEASDIPSFVKQVKLT